MQLDDRSEAKHPRQRYGDACALCTAALPDRRAVIYDRASKTIRCLECESGLQPPGDPVRVEIPGGALAVAEAVAWTGRGEEASNSVPLDARVTEVDIPLPTRLLSH